MGDTHAVWMGTNWLECIGWRYFEWILYDIDIQQHIVECTAAEKILDYQHDVSRKHSSKTCIYVYKYLIYKN